ncbi:hypothetical protein KC872_01175 [Candidatus Kaiserbacteria bacterium]|nr:hypothetical protein [Candidatus Kaiserbacteria bacterium]
MSAQSPIYFSIFPSNNHVEGCPKEMKASDTRIRSLIERLGMNTLPFVEDDALPNSIMFVGDAKTARGLAKSFPGNLVILVTETKCEEEVPPGVLRVATSEISWVEMEAIALTISFYTISLPL